LGEGWLIVGLNSVLGDRQSVCLDVVSGNGAKSFVRREMQWVQLVESDKETNTNILYSLVGFLFYCFSGVVMH